MITRREFAKGALAGLAAGLLPGAVASASGYIRPPEGAGKSLLIPAPYINHLKDLANRTHRWLGCNSYARRCLLVDELPDGAPMKYGYDEDPTQERARRGTVDRKWGSKLCAPLPYWTAVRANNKPSRYSDRIGIEMVSVDETPDGSLIKGYTQLEGAPPAKRHWADTVPQGKRTIGEEKEPAEYHGGALHLYEIQHAVNNVECGSDGPTTLDVFNLGERFKSYEEYTLNEMLLSIDVPTIIAFRFRDCVSAMFSEVEKPYETIVGNVVAHQDLKPLFKDAGILDHHDDAEHYCFTANVNFTDDERMRGLAYALPPQSELGVLSLRTNMVVIPTQGGSANEAWYDHGFGIMNPVPIARMVWPDPSRIRPEDVQGFLDDLRRTTQEYNLSFRTRGPLPARWS
jgi:hypothetical protein